MGLCGRGASCSDVRADQRVAAWGFGVGCSTPRPGPHIHAARTRNDAPFASSGHAWVAVDHHSWTIAHYESGLNNTPFVLSVIDVTVMNRVMNRISYSTACLHKILNRIILPKWRKGWDSNPRLV